MLKRLRFLNIDNNIASLNLLKILYKNGVIRSYRILNQNKISVYFKYNTCNIAFKLSIMSKPGHRIYWTMSNLVKNYNNNNFSGFYIISTNKGLYTSDVCLLQGYIGGEILFKVSI